MNTVFFVPFLLITIFVLAAMLLLPFWLKSRLHRYLHNNNPNSVYAAIMSLYGAILGLIALCGWAIQLFDLLQTSQAFNPGGNQLHNWSFTLYGYLYEFRWSTSVAVLLLLGTAGYFWLEGRRKHSN